MSYEIEWLVPERVMYVRLASTYNFKTFPQMRHDMRTTRDQGVPLVHSIIDARNVENLDAGPADLKSLFERVESSDKRGWTLILISNRFFKFLGAIAMQFAKLRYRDFFNADDALAFLSKNDDTLPALSQMKASQKRLTGDNSTASAAD